MGSKTECIAFARRNAVMVFVDFIEPITVISNFLKSERAGDHVISVIR
jgi:hypothetical protein